jgi:hypothetical protein
LGGAEVDQEWDERAIGERSVGDRGRQRRRPLCDARLRLGDRLIAGSNRNRPGGGIHNDHRAIVKIEGSNDAHNRGNRFRASQNSGVTGGSTIASDQAEYCSQIKKRCVCWG